MLPKWLCGILGGLLLVCSFKLCVIVADEELGDSSERSLDRSIELSELEYEDACVPVAEAEWSFLKEPRDAGLLDAWKDAAIKFADLKNNEKLHMTNKFKGTPEESTLNYKLSIIKNPGDASLNDTDYNKLISFIGENRVLRATARCFDGSKNLTREGAEYSLSHNAKEEKKLRIWTTWHGHFSSQVGDFLSVLHLAQKAALANEKLDVKSYWEMLTGEPNAYESFKYQLDRLTDLRMKLMNFTRKRLSEKYNIEMKNDSIPAHLLGSLSGYDWTHLALDVVPHPNVIFEIRKNFWEKKLIGKSLYKSASALGKRFLGYNPKSEFWITSNFKAECPTQLINFCKLGNMSVSTCNEPSLSNYLTAHKNVAKILMHQMSSIVPILNDANRYSVLDEAVAEFFSILAASPAWLQYIGLIDKSIGSEEAKITSLTITALDVLPRLAYYVSVDKWRLHAIEKNESNSEQLDSDFWKTRLNNEFITTSTSELPAFLSDDHIISNKPYLSKVLGIMLAFQIYDYVMKSTDIRHEPFDKSSLNSNLVRIVQNNSENWKALISKYMNIEAISIKPMSDYFSELEYYFESYEAPDQPYDFNAKEIELELLEKKYRKIANTPTTTTTSTTTTTRTTTVAAPSGKLIPNPKVSNSIPKDSLILSRSGNALSTTEKSAPGGEDGLGDLDTSLESDEKADSKPKINTNKAVWAVAAILVATVTICVIAIFGRRRCARTPKNRRYV